MLLLHSVGDIHNGSLDGVVHQQDGVRLRTCKDIKFMEKPVQQQFFFFDSKNSNLTKPIGLH